MGSFGCHNTSRYINTYKYITIHQYISGAGPLTQTSLKGGGRPGTVEGVTPTPSVPATVGTVAGHIVQNGFEGSWNEESRNAGPVVLGRTVPNAVTGVVGLLALSQRPNRCRDAPSFGQRSIVCGAAPSWQRLTSRQRPRAVVGTLGCRATATSVVATHRSGTPGPVGGTAPPPIWNIPS